LMDSSVGQKNIMPSGNWLHKKALAYRNCR
jgi:hypothetical protein